MERDNYFLIRKNDFKHQLVECSGITTDDFDKCWDALKCAFEIYLESEVG